jgi:hypothetical protein
VKDGVAIALGAPRVRTVVVMDITCKRGRWREISERKENK